MESNPDNVQWRGELIAFVDPKRSNTDKVILPQSVLEKLVDQSPGALPSPLTFSITNQTSTGGGKKMTTHVGVREFSADAGTVVIPEVVAKNIELVDGSLTRLEFVVLPKASALTIKPLLAEDQKVDDYKVMLEAHLHSAHTALTLGDVLTVGDSFRFLIESLEPAEAVCIVDTDVDLEVTGVTSGLEVGGGSDTTKQIVPEESTGLKLDPNTTQIVELTGFDRSKLQTLTLTSNGPCNAFIGVNDNTSAKCFIWSTLLGEACIPADSPYTDDCDKLYISVCNESSSKTAVSILVTQLLPESPPNLEKQSGSQCPNCQQVIPPQSFQLHTTFCQRNNIACPDCYRVFNRREGIPTEHWHCGEHGLNGDTAESLSKHNAYFHTPVGCLGCGEQFSSQVGMAFHAATSCPAALHVCRYCHLKLPRGEASAVDIMNGLSGHESSCGSRTADCPQCSRAVRLRELSTHMKIHDYERLENKTPEPCRNVNCARLRQPDTNPLGLCAFCFGPLHAQQYDPDGSKLESRIERRYVIQLTSGCGRQSCMNSYCASGTGRKLPMAEIMPLLKQLTSLPTFSFCVDELTTKRKLLVDELDREGEYSREWCVAAVEHAKGKEGLARDYLHSNAIKKSEI